jgi:DNA-binding CsgD family transcriptional regulator
MSQNNTSWLAYMHGLKVRNYAPNDLETEGLQSILNINEIINKIFNHSIPWIYLLDYTSGKYLLVSQSMRLMLGYDPDVFINGGLGFTLEKYQRDHLRLFNEEIFSDRLRILSKIPPADHPNYVFSYNFQFQTRGGNYINLLQRNCIVKSDPEGNALLSFGVITNVNHYKTENPVIQIVERVDNRNFLGAGEVLEKRAYYLRKEDAVFSKRELELLLHMADGLTSKEIADKLYLSEYTVINHRRNMMMKSNTRNVTELVAYAFRKAII